MTRYGADAIAWGQNQRSNGASGWGYKCHMFVRSCFDVSSYYGTAALGWYGADHKHPTYSGHDVPRAVPFFWTGGSTGAGHVVLSLGGGFCLSNDIVEYGHIDVASIDGITMAWGLRPMGWTEDINEVRIYNEGPDWGAGDVYLDRLIRGTRNSDSVRRLQYRLKNTTDARTPKLVVTGNYGRATVAAVAHWQKKVGEVGTDDGLFVPDYQARRMFGDKYSLHAHV